MDPGQALADLKQISAQVQEAVIFEETGSVVAATLGDDRAPAMADAGRRLLEAAGRMDEKPVVQIEAVLREGSVVVVREGGNAIVATTVPDPIVGLIFYDLRTCLRTLGEVEEKPRRRAPARRKKTESADGGASA